MSDSSDITSSEPTLPTTLVIELSHLPEEGKTFAGELDDSIFQLPARDATPVSSLGYELHVQRFEDDVYLRGYLGAAFEFTCSRTNIKFIQTISLEEVAIVLEIESGSVDATEAIREEVLINFPSYPRCDEADEPIDCEINERYLALDKTHETTVDDAPASETDDQWGALDQLDTFNKDSNES